MSEEAAPQERPARRGPGIRRLLLGVNAFVLVVPIAAIVMFRIFDTFLVGQTERRLIGEAAVLAETFREAWTTSTGQVEPPDGTPTWATGDRELYPIEPALNLGGVLAELIEPPSVDLVFPLARDRSGSAWVVGKQLSPLLDRVRRTNLSAIRVLDPNGCVVAASRGGLGECMGSLPEVAAAMAGDYGAIARERHTSGPTPPLGSLGRRGRVRVFVALPVFADGEVVGIVRLSRTSVDVVEVLWEHRWTFLLALLACILLTVGVSIFLARTIARPVRALAQQAEDVAAGDAPATFEPAGTAPAEVHRLAASLDRMTAQLTQRAAYVEAFAADVSHELKTPITSIRGAAELLEDAWGEMEPPQRQRFVANIGAAAERMERLVRELLVLARIDTSDPQRTATRAAKLLEPLRQQHPDVAIAVAADVDSVELLVDAEQISSALANLVQNAVIHGPPARVDVERRGDQVVFVVTDTGPGVPEAARARVFDRFYTTTRDEGGTGLGLAIVKAVAEQHGGTVELLPSTGKGASFALSIPAIRS